MPHKQSQNQAIDVIITWVDGNDPVLRQKRRATLGDAAQESKTRLTTAREKTRFIDNGEIRYTIASIRTFAPWVRTIFVVTDNQKPDFFTPDYLETHQIRIVDHTEIFQGYEYALPTFNSRSIETVFWRIHGLADRYIFFNDDFVLAGPVNPEDFFDDNKVVLRGVWDRIPSRGKRYHQLNRLLNTYALKWLGITRSQHLLYQMRSAELAGFSDRYYRAPHVPHPVRTRIAADFFAEHPDLLTSNIQYKLRDTKQFSVVYLSNHLEIKQNKARLEHTRDVLMLNGETDYELIFNRKFKALKNGQKRFLCLQAVEKFDERKRVLIFDYLDALLGLEPVD